MFISLLTFLIALMFMVGFVMYGYIIGYERGHSIGRNEVMKEIKQKRKATKFVDIRAD